MGLYDKDSNYVSDAAYGADTQGAYAGDSSILDQASDVITKGIPLTGLAVVNSFANTGIELANVFGAGLDKWSIANEAPDLDNLTGQTGSAEYYQEHQQGIETAALIAGSLIPGLGAIKGLKYGTEALGAIRAAQAGEASTFLSRATGLLPSLRQTAIIDQAKTDIYSSTSLFNSLTKEKYQTIALGFGDQALQNLAYGTATAVTMKASPLTDEDSLGDTVQNVLYGSVAGAGIGGLIEGIGTRATFNKILRQREATTMGQKIYDNLGMGDFAPADRVNTILSSVNDRPGIEAAGPISPVGQVIAGRTKSAALQTATKALQPIAEDPELAKLTINTLDQQYTAGNITSDDQFNMINRLAKIQRVTNPVDPTVDTGMFYVNKTAPGNSSADIPLNQLISSTSTPHPQADFTLAYQLKDTSVRPSIGSAADTRVTTEGDTVPKFQSTQDAWDQGMDMFINPKGQILVNPSAPNITPAPMIGENRVLTQNERFLYNTTGKLPEGSKPLLGSQVPTQIGSPKTLINAPANDTTGGAPGAIARHTDAINSVYTAATDFPSIQSKIQQYRSLADSPNSSVNKLDDISNSISDSLNKLKSNGVTVPQTLQDAVKTLSDARFDLRSTTSDVVSQVGVADKPGATIINFKTGAVTNSAVPTVGDFGNVKVVNGGVEYGTGDSAGFSSQDLSTPTSTSTPTVDASARYAWMDDRGFRKGDTISQDDIPALETLWRQGTSKLPVGTAPIDGMDTFSQQMKALGDKGVSIDEVGGLPDSQQQLLGMIREAKDNQIHDLMDAHPNMSSEEIALRTNVPENYLLPNTEVKGPQDYIRPVSDHTDTTHGQFWYDIGSLNTNDGMVLKGVQDMNYRTQLIKDVATSQSANFFGADFQNFISDGTADQADIKGIGGKFLASSSSNYGTLGQSFERIGRFVSAFTQRRMAGFSDTLTPAANALREDPQAAAEANMFSAVRQRTGEQYSFLPADVDHTPLGPAAIGQEGKVAVLTKSLLKDDNGNVTGWNPNYIPDGFVDSSKIADGSIPSDTVGLRTYYTLSDKVANWERSVMGVNNGLVAERNAFNAANGIQKTLPGDVLYTPPLDTSKYKYVALARALPGTGLTDDSVHAIVASSAEELQNKIGQLAPHYSVFTKGGDTNSIQAFHEVDNDYQFNRNFAQNNVTQDAARAGILNDVYPGTSAQDLIQKQIDFFAKQNTGLIRDHVELGNGQLFAELRGLGADFPAVATSKIGPVDPNLIKQVSNPYQSYINTALNISPKEQYRTWNFTNEVAENFFDTAFNKAKNAFSDYRSDIISPEAATKVAQDFGLGNVYGAATDVMKNYYGMANKLPDQKFLSKFVAGANTILGTGIIRLDMYQQLIHMVSTPMLAAVEMTSAKSQLAKQLATIDLPDGSGITIPGTTKILFNAVKNLFDPAVKEKWGDVYDMMGADKTIIGQWRESIDQLALPYGSFKNSATLDVLKKSADLMATATGSNFSTKALHFLVADAGRQLFESAGYEGKDLLDNMMTFSNRVQGNYIAAQRPVAFQGPIGQAMGLFQTFYLNLMQNAFRYVENGEGKTLAMLGGLNTSMFGLQGLPGFQAINNHLVGTAAGNDNHADLYSAIGSGLGSGRGSLGDYLLYGSFSNWLDAGLYSRGDISPRSLTLLPVNPLDFPAVKGGINVIKNIIDTGTKLSQGGDLGQTLLLGLEHNGLNRPLAGLAQMAQGFATNGEGNLQGYIKGGNTGGWSDWANMANFSRILGARPLDEAIAQDFAYRNQMYTAKDEARKEELGAAAKTYLYQGGSVPDDKMEDFAAMYSAAGGNQKSFSSSVMKWSTDASVPAANRLYRKLQGSDRAQNMMLQMGGQLLPDYSTPDTSSTDPSATDDTGTTP